LFGCIVHCPVDLKIVDDFPAGDGHDTLVHAGPAITADLAFFHDHCDQVFLLQDANVGERIAIDGDDIRELAGL
jgi:hypothetical protein